MRTLRLIFPFEPRPQQSAKFFKRGNFIKSYQPKEVLSYKAQIAYSFIQQTGGQFKWVLSTKPIRITKMWFVFPPLKSMSRKVLDKIIAWESDHNWPPLFKPTKPDIDNLQKGVLDALKSLMFSDDSQIVALDNVKKLYGTQPRTELWIEADDE